MTEHEDRQRNHDGRPRRGSPTGGETDAGRRPGAHPEVERSGKSRSTVIGLVAALALGGLLYAAITIGIAVSGA